MESERGSRDCEPERLPAAVQSPDEGVTAAARAVPGRQDPTRFPAAAPGRAYPAGRPPAASGLCGCLPADGVPLGGATAAYLACTGAGLALPASPPCAAAARPVPRFLGGGPGQAGLTAMGLGDPVLNRDLTVECGAAAEAAAAAAGEGDVPDDVVRTRWREFEQVRP